MGLELRDRANRRARARNSVGPYRISQLLSYCSGSVCKVVVLQHLNLSSIRIIPK